MDERSRKGIEFVGRCQRAQALRGTPSRNKRLEAASANGDVLG
jgi:hypothetical protein